MKYASQPFKERTLLRLLLAGFLVQGLYACSEQPAAVTATLLIDNVIVLDGSGAVGEMAAVRIAGDSITALGDLQQQPGESVLDGKGLVLAPGFIDTHSHHDDGLVADRSALPLLRQGITTAVFGQDGFHSLPVETELQAFEAEPAAINIGSYIGHGSLREAVLGKNAKRPASSEEIEAMRALLLRELESGAFGLSTGLEYEPALYSTTEEVLALAQATADIGGRYISHIRSEDRFLWDAIEEIIRIGQETRMPVQISHLKLAAKGLWGQAAQVLARLDAARAEGVDISADIYPYEYWQSTMWVLLPARDPDDLDEIAFVLDELTPADGIIFTRFEAEPDYVNKSVAKIAAERGTTEVETFSALLKESQAWSEANPGIMAESIMGRSMSEADIATLLTWPEINICSDGGYTGHPRGHGAFPRVLARYVRELAVLELEDAIAAMTSRAAAHLGITDRGRIAPGYKADLVLFDPKTIQDRAGIRDGQVLADGVVGVWVNGQRVLENGNATDTRPGRVLRRAGFN